MADNYAFCLLGVMDHLWFHHVILSSEASSLLFSKSILKPLLPFSESSSACSSSSDNSQTPLISEEGGPLIAVKISPVQDEYNKQDCEKKTAPTERPTRINHTASKTRSHSSSPSNQKSWRNLRNAGIETRLQKTMSCKSLCELEVEEVKGFMDLGFEFSKEHLSNRMMSVIPGLQRLELCKTVERNKFSINSAEEVAHAIDDDDEGKRGITRPYLSEAWLIKRPDSPLLNLRIPKVSTAADMKKLLKYWARTVASAIQQES